jgi:hypothetical protein
VKHFHTDGLVSELTWLGPHHTTPQNVTRSIIGEDIGAQVTQEGFAEAARRLSHALAEIAAVLDTTRDYEHEYRQRCVEASQKAKDVLKEWGVA